MPNENIERAIKKGMGALDDVVYEEIRYEGYGAGGVAVMVDCLTDNRNRTAPELRKIFSKNAATSASREASPLPLHRKGIIIIEGGQTTEDDVIELCLITASTTSRRGWEYRRHDSP
jgi:transcriptional/translational regulatory protein YebC/TACO1